MASEKQSPVVKNLLALLGLVFVGRSVLGASANTITKSIQLKSWDIGNFQRQGSKVSFDVYLEFSNAFNFSIPSNSINAELLVFDVPITAIDFSLPTIPPNSVVSQEFNVEISLAKILTALGLDGFNLIQLKEGLKLKGSIASNGLSIPFERKLL